MTEILQIPIDSIIKNGRRRRVDTGQVAALSQSIAKNGLINPITLDGDGKLLAGLHRLEACKMLGWETIPATLLHDISALEAELVEIDENLIRNELTPLQRGEWLLRRDDVLTAMGMRLKQGDNRFTIDRGETVSRLKTTADIAAEVGVSARSAQQQKQIARDIAPEVKEKIYGTPLEERTTDLLKLARLSADNQAAIVENITSGQAKTVSQSAEIIRKETEAQLRENPIIFPTGKYRTIVVDPPWPMKKILRETVPEQFDFDYPTMTVNEIRDLDIVSNSAMDDCHLFLWTTQKFLPASFDIMAGWGFTYIFTMVWHKNGGFQPFNLPQYNCEFVLYGRKGTPKFLETKQFFTAFNAARTGHSEKPVEFYDLLNRVCEPPKIEIFARNKRDGFDGWGNEL